MVNTSVTWFSLRIWGAKLFLHRTLGAFRFDLCNHPRYPQNPASKWQNILWTHTIYIHHLDWFSTSTNLSMCLFFVDVVCQSQPWAIKVYPDTETPRPISWATAELRGREGAVSHSAQHRLRWNGTAKMFTGNPWVFDQQIDRFFRFKCSHHPILWITHWLVYDWLLIYGYYIKQ